MHSYLITGKSQEERQEFARNFLIEKNAIETIELLTPKTKHYIKSIKDLIHRLHLKSADSERPRGVLIEDAHLLTTEAANSFLKTLEEPPGDTIFVLTASNRELVLETITSRCSVIELGIRNYELGEEEKNKAQEVFEKLTKARVGERLKFLEALGTRQEAIDFCLKQTHTVRELMLRNINIKDKQQYQRWGETIILLELLEQTRRDLEANVNVKLTMAELLLNYTKSSSAYPSAP